MDGTFGGTLWRVDWIVAGYRALVAGGIEAVRPEDLAAALGGEERDFYLTFEELPKFHAAMLEAWVQLAAGGISQAIRGSALPAREQVMFLADQVSHYPEAEAEGRALEPAIRDWARLDPRAAAAVRRVDGARLADLQDLLAQAGLGPQAAENGAALFYATMLGLTVLRQSAGLAMRPVMRSVALAILTAGPRPRPLARPSRLMLTPQARVA